MSRDFRTSDRQRRAPSPLNAERLEALALHYVGRYATSRRKLTDYLKRKIAARGWEGDAEAPVAAIVDRLATLKYVDDAAFAASRAGALGRRGYGLRRVTQALRAAGIEEDDAAPARAMAGEEALNAALSFARRKRIGPYRTEQADPELRRRQLGAMLRAGHDIILVRRIVTAAPGEVIEAD